MYLVYLDIIYIDMLLNEFHYCIVFNAIVLKVLFPNISILYIVYLRRASTIVIYVVVDMLACIIRSIQSKPLHYIALVYYHTKIYIPSQNRNFAYIVKVCDDLCKCNMHVLNFHLAADHAHFNHVFLKKKIPANKIRPFVCEVEGHVSCRNISLFVESC